jgi:predicted transcriptional regulator
MNAHEIIQQVTPALAAGIVSYFYQSEREVYKTTVSTLATQRKLRPVFVTKKSRDQQFDWVIKALSTRRSDEIAQHLLQAWLMKARSALLVSFLDEVGVEHDGSGAVEELPKELDADKVAAGIDKVLAEYPAEEVTVYLRMFQMQEANGWPAVAEALEKDPRLKLGQVVEPTPTENSAGTPED